jgi:hypothetical protein
MATGTRFFKLRAITRGLQSIEQDMELNICPTKGGVKVTPPQESYYKSVDVGATGTSANVLFDAWQIQDTVKSCGTFWKYSISANATTISKLQYPEPGKV